MSKSPIVLYLGPSMLDGAPIVVLASVGSSNVKTGAMVQTWIMRADIAPVDASKKGLDSTVCGACPRRHSLGGDCYVQPWQAPRSVWDMWNRAGKPGENWADPENILRLAQDAKTYGWRMGSYGDPMAVPASVWQAMIGAIGPRSEVGYTHQWRTPTASHNPVYGTTILHSDKEWFRDNVMASCDSPAEAALARSLGWRVFLAVMPGTPIPEKMIQCPATRDEKALTCNTCGICDGAKGRPNRASVFLVEHGARSQGKAKRFASLAVIA